MVIAVNRKSVDCYILLYMKVTLPPLFKKLCDYGVKAMLLHYNRIAFVL